MRQPEIVATDHGTVTYMVMVCDGCGTRKVETEAQFWLEVRHTGSIGVWDGDRWGEDRHFCSEACLAAYATPLA
jgi:hypothetical protein